MSEIYTSSGDVDITSQQQDTPRQLDYDDVNIFQSSLNIFTPQGSPTASQQTSQLQLNTPFQRAQSSQIYPLTQNLSQRQYAVQTSQQSYQPPSLLDQYRAWQRQSAVSHLLPQNRLTPSPQQQRQAPQQQQLPPQQPAQQQQQVNRPQNMAQQISVKLPEPEKYFGDQAKLEVWIYQVELYFGAVGWDTTNDSRRCAAYLSSLLRGPALQWHHRQSIANAPSIQNYIDLKAALIKQFGVLDVERRARDQLKNLVQKGSVQDYITKYESIIMYLPTASQAELLHAFIYGLNNTIKPHVLLQKPQNINDAQTAALTVDERHRPSYGFNPKNNFGRGNAPQNQMSQAVPMELGSMSNRQQRKQRNKAYQYNRHSNNTNYRGNSNQRSTSTPNYNNNQRNFNKGKQQWRPPPNPCMYCGGNHWNKDCKNKQGNKAPTTQRQFNTLACAEEVNEDQPSTSYLN